MNERIIAFGAVFCLLIVASFLGRLILMPAKSLVKSKATYHLSALLMGIGAIGIMTAIAGILWGFSPLIIKVVYFVLAPAIIVYWAFHFKKFSMPQFSWSIITALLLPIVMYHFLGYFFLGFSYITGSDSFSYVFVAQEYLKQGRFAPIVLEPLRETMPIFKAPCLFEMVYVTVLAMSNLVAISLIAKLQFITALLVAFFISRDIGGRHAAWVVMAVILTEPIIAYFAQESADNYFLAASFEMLCLYYIWLYHNSRKSILLVYAGIFAGMMVSTKLTTIYYWVALAGAIPFLISFPVESSKKWSLTMMCQLRSLKYFKTISAFMIPAVVVGAIFPFLIFIETKEAVIGLDWLINGFTGNNINSWIDPFYRIFYNHYTRDSDLFVSNPDLPYFYSTIKRLLSYYLVNPFQTHFSSSLSIFSHSPISLIISVIFPIYVIFSKKADRFLRLLALILSIGYVLKLINYPLCNPPKSEVFQLLAATILLSCFILRWQDTDIAEKEITCNIETGKQYELINGKNTLILTVIVIFLLPLVYVNSYRMKDVYIEIKSNSFAPAETMAVRFNQKWYIDNLSKEDTLFGRRTNELCYITRPKVIPFFWEAMYFVPWDIIEKRINDLNVTFIYDPSLPPNVVRSRYDKLMPIIKQRDKHLFDELGKIFIIYENNYTKKNRFLSTYYGRVGADDVGQIYQRKI